MIETRIYIKKTYAGCFKIGIMESDNIQKIIFGIHDLNNFNAKIDDYLSCYKSSITQFYIDDKFDVDLLEDVVKLYNYQVHKIPNIYEELYKTLSNDISLDDFMEGIHEAMCDNLGYYDNEEDNQFYKDMGIEKPHIEM